MKKFLCFVAGVSTTPDTQNTATVFFERIFDETFVPGVSEVCISSSGIAPDETIIVDLTFTLSNLCKDLPQSAIQKLLW